MNHKQVDDLSVNQDTDMGQWKIPLLQNWKEWEILSSNLKGYKGANETPVLRWVKDGKVKDLFIKGETTSSFLHKTGISLDMDKGGFVLSKRLSRILRYYLVFANPTKQVRVLRLEADPFRDKVWDGAGLISRKFMRSLLRQTPVMSNERVAKATKYEINHSGRVEFTYLSPLGQEKGHAIVVDDLGDYDLVVPDDIKSQVTIDGQFFGISFVHSKDDMRIDIQSLVNLNPFFDEDNTTKWLSEEGDFFMDRIKNGDIEALNRKVDGLSPDSITDWYAMRYFASQGQMMSYTSIPKSIVGQHLRRLKNKVDGEYRIPIHGGRYYVMPAGVAQYGKIDINVERGECVIDPKYSALWVNDEDWVEHIAEIAGGADNDDAFWCHPFVDKVDGVYKLLAWRSPNQLGEYLVFNLPSYSHVIPWMTVERTDLFASGDSSLLPPRIDKQKREYLDLVGESADLDRQQDYSLEAMKGTMAQALANGGILGYYCNMLMIAVAIFGKLPETLPARLEDVIDSTVKTGEDITKVGEWCDQYRDLLKKTVQVPKFLKKRLDKDANTTEDHWLDIIGARINVHIRGIKSARDAIMAKCEPPMDVITSGREFRDAGRELVAEYRLAFKKRDTNNALHDAEQNVLSYLEQHPDPDEAILGAFYHIYTSKEVVVSDGAVWCGDEMSAMTINALRREGALADIQTDDQGKIVADHFITPVPVTRVKITSVWFNYLNATGHQYNNMSEVPKTDQASAKSAIERMVPQLMDRTFEIVIEDGRQVAYSRGIKMGYISTAHELSSVRELKPIAIESDRDGNLIVLSR